MIKQFLTIAALGISLSSCVVSHNVHVTGNPIGTKEGVSKSNWSSDENFGAVEAAKKGNITQVGAIDVKLVNYILWSRTVTRVYGE